MYHSVNPSSGLKATADGDGGEVTAGARAATFNVPRCVRNCEVGDGEETAAATGADCNFSGFARNFNTGKGAMTGCCCGGGCGGGSGLNGAGGAIG